MNTTVLPFPALVILDRDGVINQDSKNYIKSADEWIPIPGSLEAIAEMTNAGIQIGVATNQRGISLGLYGHTDLSEMHDKMHGLLKEMDGEIHAIEFCIADDEAHPDRKPNPGMLLKIIQQLNIPQDTPIYFVGDKTSDVEAAINAGIIPVLVRTGNGMKSEGKLQNMPQISQAKSTLVFDDLAAFAHTLLSAHK